MTTTFQKDQKLAVIGFSDRPIEAYAERVTKTKLTIRFPNGHVSDKLFNIKTGHGGKQEGRHAQSSFMYYRERVEIWGPEHDARVAKRNHELAAQRLLNEIKDRVAKLHVSEVDMIDHLAAALNLKGAR